jgi:hypothetical protein
MLAIGGWNGDKGGALQAVGFPLRGVRQRKASPAIPFQVSMLALDSSLKIFCPSRHRSAMWLATPEKGCLSAGVSAEILRCDTRELVARVPSVYLTLAEQTILAFLQFNEISNLRSFRPRGWFESHHPPQNQHLTKEASYGSERMVKERFWLGVDAVAVSIAQNAAHGL